MLKPGVRPYVLIRILTPDGRRIERTEHFAADQGSFSKERCEVRIANNTISGDLTTYHVFADIDGVQVDLKLTRTSALWLRDGASIAFRNPNDYFAWYPAVLTACSRVH